MNAWYRPLAVLGIALALAPVTPAAPLGPPAAADGVRWELCDNVIVAIRVPERRVEPLVPAPFRIATDTAGNAQLSIIMVRCELLSVDGGPASPATLVHPVVALEPPPQPFQGARTTVPLPTEFHYFQLWLATDNPDLVRHLRRHGSTGESVRFVDDLVFDVGDDGTFRFQAPSPAPSPFVVAGRPGPLSPAGIDIHPRFYWPAPRGVQVIDDDLVEGFRFGPFTDWRIDPVPGSLLDLIICDSPRTFDQAGGLLGDESLTAGFDRGTFTTRLHDRRLTAPGDVSCDRH